MNREVYKSESDTNQRNQAIGMLMFAYGLIKANPQQATDLYTRQCSINVNAKDLAIMAATLANGGTNPVTKKKVADPQNVAGVNKLEGAELESPLFWPAPSGLVMDAVVGGAESAEYLKQSRRLTDVWGLEGVRTRYEEIDGANHFTVIAGLADPQDAMTRRVAELAGA